MCFKNLTFHVPAAIDALLSFGVILFVVFNSLLQASNLIGALGKKEVFFCRHAEFNVLLLLDREYAV